MKKLMLPVVLILGLILVLSLVSAEKYTINIRGDPRTPDGKIDLMYSAGLAID